MTTATTDARAEIAAGMVHVAARLVGLVRDWDPGSVQLLLDRLSTQQQAALCVVLAAAVDQDRSMADLLAWIDWPDNYPHITPTDPTNPNQRRDHGGPGPKAIAEQLDITCREARTLYERNRRHQQRTAA